MGSRQDWQSSSNSFTVSHNVQSNINMDAEYPWPANLPPTFSPASHSQSYMQSEPTQQSQQQYTRTPYAHPNFHPNGDSNFEFRANNSCGKPARKTKRNMEKSRKVWTFKEEEQLIVGLKGCVANGLKGDNGFRIGYLAHLEKHLQKCFPGTDLKGDPHVTSKIHVWKKHYGILCNMLGTSGFGWDDRSCQIMVDDDVWDAFVKNDKELKSWRKKIWPLYSDWQTVFGKDRANGEFRTTISDALNDLCTNDKDTDAPISLGVGTSKASPSTSAPFHSDADSSARIRNRCETVTSPSKSENGAKKKARLADGETLQVVNRMGRFFSEINSHMGDIKHNLGTEREAIEMRRKVVDAIRPLESLSLKDKLFIAGKICEKPTDVDYFMRLDDEERKDMVRMIKSKEYQLAPTSWVFNILAAP